LRKGIEFASVLLEGYKKKRYYDLALGGRKVPWQRLSSLKAGIRKNGRNMRGEFGVNEKKKGLERLELSGNGGIILGGRFEKKDYRKKKRCGKLSASLGGGGGENEPCETGGIKGKWTNLDYQS